MISNSIYGERRKELAETLEDNSVSFLFSGTVKQRTWDQDYPFCVNRNFFYLTGLDNPNDILVIAKLNRQVKEYLFVSRPDPYYELYHGKMLSDEEFKEFTGITNVFYHDRFDWEIGRLLSRSNFLAMNMDFHKREIDSSIMPENEMSSRIMSAHPYLKLNNIAKTINNMRRIKSDEEIAKIREAVRITGLGIESILENLSPGIYENQLQAAFEFTLRNEGAINAFDPIIAGGKNSVVLHYNKNDQQLKEGELLLLDLGAEVDYYAADISRTFPVSGYFTEEQRYVYETVIIGQDAVINALKPGLEINKTLDIALEAMFPRCKERGFANNLEDMKKLLPHGICHYIGLDVHDVGDQNLLEPGMVVTIEPGLYLPDLGFGIRIEDDALITNNSCEVLSKQILRSVDEIERFVKDKIVI
ncbi:MAG: aminopeptidase P N-terminal domain-containing protein [Saccharofermentanales bacterium]|jgi:Xaa-Pro aminopeptidase